MKKENEDDWKLIEDENGTLELVKKLRCDFCNTLLEGTGKKWHVRMGGGYIFLYCDKCYNRAINFPIITELEPTNHKDT